MKFTDLTKRNLILLNKWSPDYYNPGINFENVVKADFDNF